MPTISATYQGNPIEVTSIDYQGGFVNFTYRDPADNVIKANKILVQANTSASTDIFPGATINFS